MTELIASREKQAAEHGHTVYESALCEKCGEMPMAPAMYRPFGGATSFADLFAYRDAQKIESATFMATYDYQDLSRNITSDSDMDADEKAAALVALANEFQSVVRNAPTLYKEREEVGEKAGRRMRGQQAGLLRAAVDSLKKLVSWSGYEDDDEDDDDEDEQKVTDDKALPYGGRWERERKDYLKKHNKCASCGEDATEIDHITPNDGKDDSFFDKRNWKALCRSCHSKKTARSDGGFGNPTKEIAETMLVGTEKSGFTIFKQKDGSYRWLAFSSNAFKDHDDELFTTAALEEAVEYADKEDDRGPLRIFHVKGADIGDADFQAVVGRFLVESGTFRDDELGQKGLDYFLNNQDEKFQVSIGFNFRVGDEKDGVYDWLRIKERSVTPYGRAANPFTSFTIGELGDAEMDDAKSKWMTDIFGEETAKSIISKAEGETKSLEDAGVSFKSSDGTKGLLADLKALPEAERKGVQALIDKYSKGEDDSKKESDDGETPAAPAAGMVDAERLGIFLSDLAAKVDVLMGVTTAVEDLTKQVKDIRDAADASKENTPRGVNTFRRAAEQGITLDPDKVKAILGEDADDGPVNPALPYLADLAGLRLS